VAQWLVRCIERHTTRLHTVSIPLQHYGRATDVTATGCLRRWVHDWSQTSDQPALHRWYISSSQAQEENYRIYSAEYIVHPGLPVWKSMSRRDHESMIRPQSMCILMERY